MPDYEVRVIEIVQRIRTFTVNAASDDSADLAPAVNEVIDQEADSTVDTVVDSETLDFNELPGGE